jgi:2'-5' RNA ligase
MVNYQKKQRLLFEEIEKDFREGKSPSTIVDPVKDYANDNQICLTSVVFLSDEIRRNIEEKIILPLKKLDKRQYCYLQQSLHVTVQNIRTIHDPPLFSADDVEKVKEVLRRIIPKYRPFEFSIRGIFDLPTSLSLRAYSEETFGKLVLELRNALEEAKVPDNKKYASSNTVIANATVCRYSVSPSEVFLAAIREMKEINIGSTIVKEIFLISTNAVCHPDKTKIIERYLLRD